MKASLPLLLIFVFCMSMAGKLSAQTCPMPSDNQSTQGTNNRWFAYFYRNDNLTLYHGRVTYENGNNLDFDLNFQGSNTDYDPISDPAASANTFRCGLNTETFSARFRVRQAFAEGVHDLSIATSEGFRLYVDGTLVLNSPNEKPYAEFKVSRFLTAGLHTLTIEYYERTGENRLKFQMSSGCRGTNFATPDYAAGTQWNAYLYQGINFDQYKGKVTVGAQDMNYINLDFGGDATIFRTDECAIHTDLFSARLYQKRHVLPGTYLFTLGGDDGYRLSIDGGNTWIINEWYDHGIQTSAVPVTITSERDLDLVIEYYDAGQGNALIFDIGHTLPVDLVFFEGKSHNNKAILHWQTTASSTEDHFIVELSTNGKDYAVAGTVMATALTQQGQQKQYSFHTPLHSAGAVFYRLKMIDQAGNSQYSPIVTINKKEEGKLKIYPTIISQPKQLFIRTGNSLHAVKLVITDFSGRQVQVKELGQLSAGQLFILPLQHSLVSKGSYFVSLYSNGTLAHKQTIIVQ